MFDELRRLRRYLGLRQQDVSFATGISINRISAAENGRCELNEVEKRLLHSYYTDRMQMLRDAKRGGQS